MMNRAAPLWGWLAVARSEVRRMFAAQLVMAGILGLAAGPDEPSVLVERLGAPRYAEREAATRALEALGREAIPALRQARRSDDPEVRSRAAGLLGRIEAAAMIRPTLVQLDFRDRPIAEVVKTLSDRTGVPMVLVPENNPQWQSRRMSLEAPQAVTFWGLFDRLNSGGLAANVAMGGVQGSRGPIVHLYQGPLAAPLPTSDSGPFRATIHGIHYHRDRAFGGPRPGSLPFAQPGQVPRPPDAAAATVEQFFLDLQVAAEPRMAITQNGPLKLVEALDDKGNNLLPPSAPEEPVRRVGSYFSSATMAGMPSVQVQVQLRHPHEPGQTIKRLRGTLPVVVSARKDDPLVIDLASAKGKTFQTQDCSLTIHDMRTDPEQPRTTIELSLRSNVASDGADGGPLATDLMAFRGPNLPMSQVEIFDAQGRTYLQWFPTSTRRDADALQMTLTLLPAENLGPPTQLRFYDLARASTEFSFEFHDVPMP
jgi:hypothetical protein